MCVREEMNKADRLDGKRRSPVGFTPIMLQRRLASSPESIYQSHKHRRERLLKRVAEERDGGSEILDTIAADAPDENDLPNQEFETQAEDIIGQATTARTIKELVIEINLLTELEEKSFNIVRSNVNRKWEELLNFSGTKRCSAYHAAPGDSPSSSPSFATLSPTFAKGSRDFLVMSTPYSAFTAPSPVTRGARSRTSSRRSRQGRRGRGRHNDA
jgi:hypothetical protein